MAFIDQGELTGNLHNFSLKLAFLSGQLLHLLFQSPAINSLLLPVLVKMSLELPKQNSVVRIVSTATLLDRLHEAILVPINRLTEHRRKI